ncbi:hypothetical protein FB45DRAFT_1135997 [Roridomyces roridus]|uniref:Uncharacterized protein n=1 Tax=Roridomyces roridus TaxID=1738132 RepID=A0AAD7B0Q6_9AGAR|nr:hypothetical protein FB45DRAFT_1135997 [Roridomyces roridus]
MPATTRSVPIPYTVPRRGALAVMTLDPVASLSYLPDDPMIAEMCAKLVNKDYVVYVTDGYNQPFNPNLPDQLHIVEFLVHGRPPAVDALCITSSMNIPMYNAHTDPPSWWSHPNSEPRLPLQCASVRSPGIPWPECYLSPFIATRVRCPTLISNDVQDPITHFLDIPEQLRHDECMREDVASWRRNLSRRENEREVEEDIRQRHLPEPLSDVDPWEEEEEEEDENFALPRVGLTEEDFDWGYQGPVPVFMTLYRNADSLYHPEAIPPLPASPTLAVTFHHDLSRVQMLHNPLEFFEEEDKIREIASVCRLRQQHCVIENAYDLAEPEQSDPRKPPSLYFDETIGRLRKNVLRNLNLNLPTLPKMSMFSARGKSGRKD